MIATEKAKKRVAEDLKEPFHKRKRKLIDKDKRLAEWNVMVQSNKAGQLPGVINRYMVCVDGFSEECIEPRAKQLFLEGYDVWIEPSPDIGCQTFYNMIIRYRKIIADQADLMGEMADVMNNTLWPASSDGAKRLDVIERSNNLNTYAVMAISDADRSIQNYQKTLGGNHVELDD